VARKRSQDNPAQKRPLSVEFLRELGALKGLTPPPGPFDPAGAWEAGYRLWLVQRYLGGGCMHLRREPADGGGARLHVRLAVAEVGGYVRRTEAVLDCAADALCTPKSWKLSSVSVGLDDRPIAGTEVAETGTLAGGRIVTQFAGQRRERKLAGPVTSNFSLFEAVQRLAGEKARPLEFTMLEEMDLVKPGQRLAFREAKALELNGAKVALRGYDQLGRGVLPWQYWTDERGRLLLAFSGVRAWVRDPKADPSMQERLERARSRQKRAQRAR